MLVALALTTLVYLAFAYAIHAVLRKLPSYQTSPSRNALIFSSALLVYLAAVAVTSPLLQPGRGAYAVAGQIALGLSFATAVCVERLYVVALLIPFVVMCAINVFIYVIVPLT